MVLMFRNQCRLKINGLLCVILVWPRDFVLCGEKWSRYHVCKSLVQLNVVQELIDHIQSEVSGANEESNTEQL